MQIVELIERSTAHSAASLNFATKKAAEAAAVHRAMLASVKGIGEEIVTSAFSRATLPNEEEHVHIDHFIRPETQRTNTLVLQYNSMTLLADRLASFGKTEQMKVIQEQTRYAFLQVPQHP